MRSALIGISLVACSLSAFGLCDKEQVLSQLKKVAESPDCYWAWTSEYLDIWKHNGDGFCAMRCGDGSWRPLPYDSVKLETEVLKHTEGRRALVNYWELFSIAGTWWPDEYYAVNRASTTAQVKKLWQDHHALPVFSWHIDNPCCTNRFPSGDSYRFVESGVCSNMVRCILDGTPYPCGTDTIMARKCRKAFASPREWYFKQLDDIADFFNGLTDDVTKEPIPIVMRYAHEMEGDWFWWGRTWCSREDFRRFCRMTADYLRMKCGENRMLFAYTPDRFWTDLGKEGDNGNTFLSYYPGDKYVDIIGIDDYSIGRGDDAQAERAATETIRKLRLMSAFAKEHGKVNSIAECGGTQKRDDFWKWVEKILAAPGVEVAFVDTWTGRFGTLPKTPAEAKDLLNFVRRPTTLMSAADPVAAGAEPELVFGVTSDIHLYAGDMGTSPDGTQRKWLDCLRYFDSMKVDAVAVAGDLADQGFKEDLELVKSCWTEVFGSEDRRSDGGKIVPLWIYGDHDCGGYLYDKDHKYDKFFKTLKAKLPDSIVDEKSYEDYMYARSIYYPVGSKKNLPSQVEKLWKSCMGSAYKPYRTVMVKGYKFILEQFGADDIWRHDHGESISLPEYVAANTRGKDEMFFFLGHRTPDGFLAFKDNDRNAARALGGYRNAIAFSGHHHLSYYFDLLYRSRETSSAGFTCVSVPSLCYVAVPKDGNFGVLPKNGEYAIDGKSTQCYVVKVYARGRIEIERHDFGQKTRAKDLDGISNLPTWKWTRVD